MPANDESILTSIKKLLMISEDDTAFDQDITIHINTILANLNQMGVGIDGGLIITGKDNVWSEFIGERNDTQQIKTYVYIKVRLLFDPPTNSSAVESLNRQASELEYRLYTTMGGY